MSTIQERTGSAISGPSDGRTDALAKCPLLLINGMAVSSRAWPAPWLDRLGKSFQLLLMDNRGTSASSFGGAPFSIGDLARDAAAVVDRSGHGAVDVLGHSMGAMIALALAVDHPARVRRLVVVAPQLGGPGTVSAQPEVLSRMASLPLDGSCAEQRLRLSNPGWARRDAETLSAVAACHARESVDRTLIGMQIQAMATVDPTRITEIAAPTLVLHGGDDPVVPPENGRLVAAAVSGARLKIMAGMGHHVIYEAMEPSARLIEAFLDPQRTRERPRRRGHGATDVP